MPHEIYVKQLQATLFALLTAFVTKVYKHISSESYKGQLKWTFQVNERKTSQP